MEWNMVARFRNNTAPERTDMIEYIKSLSCYTKPRLTETSESYNKG
jgi:hypothetical protein